MEGITGTLVVERCSVESILCHADFSALWAEAARECANPDVSAARPDAGLYRLLEQSGSAICLFCEDAKRLHGFALALVSPSAHNGQRYATVESLFVSQQARKRGAGIRMMEAVEAAASEAECEAVFYSAHVGSQLARLFFLCEDRYRLTNHIFMRRLR